jgi:hypothetical protein
MVEEIEEKEGRRLVWIMEARSSSIYRGARCCAGAGEVEHGDGDWDDEGARRSARGVAGIMVILVSLTARQKVV